MELRMKLLRLGIMMNSERIEDEQYPCDKCEYYAIHLNYMKRHKLAQHVGVCLVLNVHDTNTDEDQQN